MSSTDGKIVRSAKIDNPDNKLRRYHLTPKLPQPNPFEGMCCAKLRNVIWKLFEDPNSSTAAKVARFISKKLVGHFHLREGEISSKYSQLVSA